MGFSQDEGYIAVSIEEIMDSFMENINTQFSTTYTTETFLGTNFYKYFYAIAQRLQENEVKTAEILLKLQQYLIITNESILRPAVTNPGLIGALEAADYIASVKKPIDADAGKVFVCVDADDGDHAIANVTITSYANLVSGTPDSVSVNGTAFTAQATAVAHGGATFQAATSNTATAKSLADQINYHATVGLVVKARAIGAIVYLTAVHGGTAGNAIALAYTNNDANVGATKSGTVFSGGTDRTEYAAEKLEICTIIKDSTVAGTVSQGTESSSIALTNSQTFDFKFNLPNRIRVLLRLTTYLSLNNQVVVGSPDDTKALLLANIAARYKLGKDFAPQRYFNATDDAPWASSVLVEWSSDLGANYYSTVYTAAYDDLFEFSIADVSLVEL
jgi:hypothetical protein